MSQEWDDFSRSLAEGLVPRRESLRRLGVLLAGAVVGPLGMASPWAVAGKPRAGADPCKAFCKCTNKRQQDACLTACRACNGVTSKVCGSCGTGFACTDTTNDVRNCGACRNACTPGMLETAACVSGSCRYSCVAGAVYCDGACTYLNSDVSNCGACGNACEPGPNETAACIAGACVYECSYGSVDCTGTCVSLSTDPDNCGACGNTCGGATPYCYAGTCTDCSFFGGSICGGVCTDIMWDSLNCGACGNECAPVDYCAWGTCEGYYYGG